MKLLSIALMGFSLLSANAYGGWYYNQYGDNGPEAWKPPSDDDLENSNRLEHQSWPLSEKEVLNFSKNIKDYIETFEAHFKNLDRIVFETDDLNKPELARKLWGENILKVKGTSNSEKIFNFAMSAHHKDIWFKKGVEYEDDYNFYMIVADCYERSVWLEWLMFICKKQVYIEEPTFYDTQDMR